MDAVEAVLQCIFSTACFRQGILFSLSRKHVADIAGFFIFGLKIYRAFSVSYRAWSWSGNGLAGREPALDISFIDEVAIDSCLLKP